MVFDHGSLKLNGCRSESRTMNVNMMEIKRTTQATHGNINVVRNEMLEHLRLVVVDKTSQLNLLESPPKLLNLKRPVMVDNIEVGLEISRIP
jgi:hypothetical protein